MQADLGRLCIGSKYSTVNMSNVLKRSKCLRYSSPCPCASGGNLGVRRTCRSSDSQCVKPGGFYTKAPWSNAPSAIKNCDLIYLNIHANKKKLPARATAKKPGGYDINVVNRTNTNQNRGFAQRHDAGFSSWF